MPRTDSSERILSASSSNALGAFGGVFTPSILTILGVIMFMRAGFVVGQAGIFHALLILVLAKGITTMTAFSISAVSTNTPVAGGGAYFLISRALGPESGGAIGLALFIAQAVSVPFYTLGFTEALVRTFPTTAPHFRTIALAAALFLFLLAYVGARWAIKAQYVIMTVLGLSIVAFLSGSLMNFESARFVENWLPAYSGSGMSFWRTFAIYFPAATGIMAGVNMSGDLKDPGRAIPVGTFMAVGTGFVIYLVQILAVGGAQSRFALVEAPFETLCAQAPWGTGFLVVAGVFAATLSSALGSFLGAPRVLQAVSRDHVIDQLAPFAQGSRKGDEPHRALWLTLAITVAVILWAGTDVHGGAFNTLAAVVTMFFLYTYGMVNLAALLESAAGNPSFRPRFRYYHWLPAMAGAVACAGTAVLIDPLAASLAAVAVCILYTVLRRKVLRVRFGDARWGFFFSRMRHYLMKLSTAAVHPKNWRPTILVLTGNPATRYTMAMVALWLGAERGLVTLAQVLVGDLERIGRLRSTAIEQLDAFIRENHFEALSAVVVAENLDLGIFSLLQGHAVNPLTPNLVIMGWSSEPDRAETFVDHMATVRLLNMSLVVICDHGLPARRRRHRIDVWWQGRENGPLMVLLAHLLTLNGDWSDARIRLIREIPDEAGRQPVAEAMASLLADARVDAEVQILVSTDPFIQVVHRHSADATMVFIGFFPPDKADAHQFQRNFEKILASLPTTLLICSSGKADLMA